MYNNIPQDLHPPTHPYMNSKGELDLVKALKECEKEKIQVPGFIQPNGVIFCVDKKTLKVLQCSANVEDMLGIPLSVVVCTDKRADFDPPTLTTLLDLSSEQTASLCNAEMIDFTLPLRTPPTPTIRSTPSPLNASPLSLESEYKDKEKEKEKDTDEHEDMEDDSSPKYRKRCTDFIAFCSRVPSLSSSLQLFASPIIGSDEGAQLMIVEVEPCGDKEQYYQRTRRNQTALQRLSKRLAATYDVLEACRVAAEEIRYVTGLDRVMVYEFDREWHGDILVELTREGVPQIYLGLRFPATDIPAQARQLYTINPFRLISNTLYTPVPVVPTRNPLTNASLDMSFVTFRSVSPVHIQYLKNIDVMASMSISIIVNDAKLQQKKLYGLIVCHNLTPKFLPYDVRETCNIIGQLISFRVENLLHNTLNEKRQAMKEVVQSIASSHIISDAMGDDMLVANKDQVLKPPITSDTTTNPNFLKDAEVPYSPPHPLASLASVVEVPELTGYANDVLRLFDADYGLIVVQGMRRLLGTPAASEVVFLASFEQYVATSKQAQIFYSNRIAKSIPEMVPVAEGYSTSGVVYIPLAMDATSYLALFRYEQVHHVKWAGAPQKAVAIHPVTKRPALVPRTSFTMWSEEVRGTSREWTELEIETAHNLFVNLMELVRLIKLRVRIVEETIARKKLEREKIFAEESNKMKSQFLANLSHEVRTPLNAIIGMVDLTLSTTKVDSTQANYLAAVQHASESLLLIINDLLDLSKIEAGKLVIVHDTFDFGKLIEQTVSAYKIAMEGKGIVFRLEVDPSIPEIISTDSVRLCQVLSNLLSNAKKYTVSGFVEMKVYPVTSFTAIASRKESAKDEDAALDDYKYVPEASKSILHFSIRDSGIGIPIEKLELVFEPFEQVDSHLTRKSGGTGLGLSICKRIVCLMGGQLWCESEIESGSVFHFEIPIEIGAKHETTTKDGTTPRNGTDFLHINPTIFPRPIESPMDTESNAIDEEVPEIPKVLVVEDNVLNQKVAVNMLQRLNIASDIAGNGEIAVNLYREHPNRYAAILMDICMPVMDGLVASAEIRIIESLRTMARSARTLTKQTTQNTQQNTQNVREGFLGDAKRIPIIALSAQVMDQDRDACAGAGMDGFLEKPVRIENIKKLMVPIFSQFPKWKLNP